MASATRMFCRLGFGVGWRRYMWRLSSSVRRQRCSSLVRESVLARTLAGIRSREVAGLQSVRGNHPNWNPGDGACEMGISHEQGKHWRTSRQWHPAPIVPIMDVVGDDVSITARWPSSSATAAPTREMTGRAASGSFDAAGPRRSGFDVAHHFLILDAPGMFLQ